MGNASTIKQVSRIEYVGPYQIQTTSIMSANFSAHLDDFDEKRVIEIPLDSKNQELTMKLQQKSNCACSCEKLTYFNR